MTEDQELLETFVSHHSEEAFSELVHRHINLVYHTALRRVGGDTHLAEDIAQGVFIALAKKAADLRTRPGIAGWLYTSTRFAAAQAVRTERRRRVREQEAQIMEAVNEVFPHDWERIGPVLDDALDELGEKDRDLVLSRFFENRPLADVGSRFSLSPDAARMRIDRALEKLRKVLAKRGVTSTAAAIAEVFTAQAGRSAPAGLAPRIASHAFPQAATAVVTGSAVLSAHWKLVALGSAVVVVSGVVALGYHLSHAVSAPAMPQAQQPSMESAATRTASPSNFSVIRRKQRPGVDNRVARLDRLVGLSDEQKLQAATIFGRENDQLMAIPRDDRLVQGRSFRVQSRADIRSILTASQQKIYDQSPQRLGGGSLYDPAVTTARLDQAVTLSDEQLQKAAAAYEHQAEALQSLPADATDERKQIERETQKEISSILTPEQNEQMTENPVLLMDLDNRLRTRTALKESPVVTALVGEIQETHFIMSTVQNQTRRSDQTIISQSGQDRYRVIGKKGSAAFTVNWVKPKMTEPLRVTEIVAGTGSP